MRLAGHEVGLERPLFLIAGPCTIESRELAIETAGRLKELTAAIAMPFIYRSSIDNAWPLGRMAELLALLAEMDASVKRRGFVEAELAA